MPPGTQIDKTTCFLFRKADDFLRLLRLLPQAPCGQKLPWVTQKTLWLRDYESLLLDKQISPPGWAAIRSLYAVWGSFFLFIKLCQQHIYMGSGEVIEKSLLGFPGQFFLQLCFRADLVELEADTEPAIDPIETAFITVRGQISTLQSQQENIYEYLGNRSPDDEITIRLHPNLPK